MEMVKPQVTIYCNGYTVPVFAIGDTIANNYQRGHEIDRYVHGFAF